MGLGFSPGDGKPSSYCWARPHGERGSVQELMISSLLLISALKSSIIFWLWLPAPFHIFLAMSPLLHSLSVSMSLSARARAHTHTHTQSFVAGRAPRAAQFHQEDLCSSVNHHPKGKERVVCYSQYLLWSLAELAQILMPGKFLSQFLHL